MVEVTCTQEDIMALLDSVLSGVSSLIGGDNAKILNGFVESNGGVQGLADTFQRSGLGGVFSSWVGTGENQAITAQQIESVMGNAHIQELAQKMGLDPTMAAEAIAKALPQLIDRSTPDGRIG
jgi:uncharacterized protein YidB (DUF937 family)